MSWSVATEGTRDEVKAKLDETFAVAQRSYPPGTTEGDDVVAAKARVAAYLGTRDGDKKVRVSAYGSHGVVDGRLVNASFTVTLVEQF